MFTTNYPTYPFQNEPMCEALGGLDSAVMDLWIIRMVQSGLCFEAIDTRKEAVNQRVGVFLCTLYEKDVPHPIDEEVNAMTFDKKMGQIFDILHQPHPIITSEIYDRRGRSRYLDGTQLSVIRDYGGQGIAGKLIEAVENKARDMGVDLVCICCTSEYSARAVSNRGYHIIHSYRYDEYVRDGQQIFQPKEPHVAIQSYIKILN